MGNLKCPALQSFKIMFFSMARLPTSSPHKFWVIGKFKIFNDFQVNPKRRCFKWVDYPEKGWEYKADWQNQEFENHQRPIVWPVKTCVRRALSQWKQNYVNWAKNSKIIHRTPAFFSGHKTVQCTQCTLQIQNFPSEIWQDLNSLS